MYNGLLCKKGGFYHPNLCWTGYWRRDWHFHLGCHLSKTTRFFISDTFTPLSSNTKFKEGNTKIPVSYVVYNCGFKMGQFLGEGNRSDPQKGFEIIPSDDHHTWPASGLRKQPLQNMLNCCTWIYHSFQETGCTPKQAWDVYFIRNTNKTKDTS